MLGSITPTRHTTICRRTIGPWTTESRDNTTHSLDSGSVAGLIRRSLKFSKRVSEPSTADSNGEKKTLAEAIVDRLDRL